MLYAVLAVSSIARGRVAFLDVAAAKAHPGVVEVMTPANRPPLAQDPDAKTNPFMFRMELLQNDRVRYANQPIAVVIAETLEAATEGAALLAPRYEARAGARRPRCGRELRAAGRRRRRSGRSRIAATSRPASPRPRSGSRRPTRRRRSITTPWSRTRSSRPGTATGCRSTRRARVWRWRRGASPGCSASPPENIHIRSPFLGGGFGSKGLRLRAAGARHPRGAAGRPAGQAGAAPRADVRARRPSRADAADAAPRRRRRRRADRARPPREDGDEQLRRLLRAGRRRLAHALREPGHRHDARGGAARHRHAAVHARARRGDGLDRAGERHRRDGAGLRHGPAGVPAEELRRGRADLRQAVLLEGAARVLRARRRALRLGAPPARAAADARRGRACWSAGAWAPRPSRR